MMNNKEIFYDLAGKLPAYSWHDISGPAYELFAIKKYGKSGIRCVNEDWNEYTKRMESLGGVEPDMDIIIKARKEAMRRKVCLEDLRK